ncbi:MAG: hypothetical protein IT210_03915 [Armatimonadetes bacterium]|nr:hypothetical protein [Armatimonadota bacterium]
MKLPLQDTITVSNQAIAPTRSAQIPLPPLPGKPGKAVVLRFRIVCQSAAASGCNYHAALRLNDAPIGRYSAGGEERMVGREPTFTLKDHTGEFHAFSGSAILTMFAPDVKTGDAMTGDELGATYALDISDIARGVDGNTFSVQNTLQQPFSPEMGSLVIENIEIGWLDRSALSRPATPVPQRGPITDALTEGPLTLAVGKAGGFTVRTADSLELAVETALGMQAAIPPALAAEDALPAQTALASPLAIEPWGPNGYKVTASWPSVKLTRIIAIRNGLVVWKEEWQNTGDKIIGVPFRHRIFLKGEAARFWLAGSPENTALAASSQNPTAFLESRQSAGNGFGVTAESDWLRLLMWLRARAGVGEIYSETLALAPGSAVDFELSIAPVADGGGYWSFINGVRSRWGLNGIPMKQPVFWGYERAPGKTTEEAIRKSLGHLGPVTLALSPWQRLEPDARTVQAGQYPKLPPQAPRTPGKCPDLDVEAFLTFEHRARYEQPYAKEVADIHRALPQVKVIHLSHPSMEAVYRPLLDRWPIAAEAIRTRDGAPFEDAGYSRAWVGDMIDKDWGVLYFVPRPGSRYLGEILRNMRRSMDEYGSDGIYSDEFSWGYTRREYSRYDYSRWDGYSADLDGEGNIVRLKSDNAHTTESAQAQAIREVHTRGKIFLANGAASLRSITSLPYARFVEGGNGHPWMSNAHLNPTPLILGNMGDEKTLAGVFESVKSCLSVGCVYSPIAVNLLLEGADNFVCKLYPLTIREIRPGAVLGDERLITSASGSFRWPGRPAQVRLYRYDAAGKLIDKEKVIQTAAGRPFQVEVPEKGLVIAEMVSRPQKPPLKAKAETPQAR